MPRSVRRQTTTVVPSFHDSADRARKAHRVLFGPIGSGKSTTAVAEQIADKRRRPRKTEES